MIRRYFLRILAVSPFAGLAAMQSARGETVAHAAGPAIAPAEGIRLYEVAYPDELERVGALPPFAKRREFKIVYWEKHHYDHEGLAKLFNELSIAGYHYVECTFCDGIRGQYIFYRTIPREELA